MYLKVDIEFDLKVDQIAQINNSNIYNICMLY